MSTEYTYRPKPDSPFAMTKEEVAEWFLDIHWNWFRDPRNDLFGFKEPCQRALVDYLDMGIVAPEGTRQGYAVMKFRREVEDWFEKIERKKEK